MSDSSTWKADPLSDPRSRQGPDAQPGLSNQHSDLFTRMVRGEIDVDEYVADVKQRVTASLKEFGPFNGRSAERMQELAFYWKDRAESLEEQLETLQADHMRLVSAAARLCNVHRWSYGGPETLEALAARIADAPNPASEPKGWMTAATTEVWGEQNQDTERP